MIFRVFFGLLWILYYMPGYGQDTGLLKDIPDAVSVDRAGNIYIATRSGDVYRMDASLNHQLVFSPQNPAKTDALEAWQGLRIFTFHRDLQMFRLINRNLSLHEDYSFNPQIADFVELATPSFDNNVWLIDQTSFSLRKYNITQNTLLVNTPINTLISAKNHQLLALKEYQNKLFLSTKNHGILIFDNLGNYIMTYPYQDVGTFGFWKDDLYFIRDNELVIQPLYGDIPVTIALPAGSWKFAVKYGEHTYLLSDREIIKFQ